MDATVKQRILGVIVLVGLLGFCLAVLLRNTKTQPHIPKINTHPVLTQTLSPVETPNSVFAKPETTLPNTTSKAASNITTKPQQKDIIPAPAAIAPAPITAATPVVAQPVLQAPPQSVQNVAPSQQADVDLTGNSPTASATSASLVVPTMSTTTPTTAQTTATAPIETHHKQQHHHHAASAIKETHHKETSKSAATTADHQKNMMVQVGTFSLPANAAALVDKLHSKGFAAVSEKMKTSKGTMTRVIVGKNGLDHAQAETLRKDLEKSMSLNGIIVSHNPVIPAAR